MQTATKSPKNVTRIIHRTSFTEKLIFTSRPDAATRRALRNSGWRWNGVAWWRNTNATVFAKPRSLPAIIAPTMPIPANDNEPEPEAASA